MKRATEQKIMHTEPASANVPAPTPYSMGDVSDFGFLPPFEEDCILYVHMGKTTGWNYIAKLIEFCAIHSAPPHGGGDLRYNCLYGRDKIYTLRCSGLRQDRKKNGWFIGRTAKIRDIEMICYVAFLRPPMFGKSIHISILLRSVFAA